MTKIAKKTKSGKIFSGVMVLLCFALCVTLADLFSSAITAGNFSSIFSTTNKIASYDIYAISMFQTSILSSAEENCESLKTQNGAGYIWSENGVYYVLVSAYEKQNDAELVRDNLNSQAHSSTLLKISIPEIALTSNLTTQEKNSLSTSLAIFKETYKSLYDISISLDTSVKTEAECKLALNDILSKISKAKTSFDNTFSNKLTNSLLNLKLKLTSLEDIVKELIDCTSTTSIPFASKIKYNYISVIKLNKTLCKEINNEI